MGRLLGFTFGKSLPKTLVALGLAVGVAALAGAQSPYCAPAPEIKAALDAVPDTELYPEARYHYEQRRLAAIKAILQEHPNDFFARRAYMNEIGLASGNAGTTALRAEDKAAHEAHPDDPADAYFYAEMLTGRDTPTAIKILDGALEEHPDFPWPHLQLGFIYAAPNFLDKQKSTANYQQFIESCPAQLSAYGGLGPPLDQPTLRKMATQMRSVIGSRTDKEALRVYSYLWSLEFKSRTQSEYDGERKQVAADVARLRTLNLWDEWQWYEPLVEGYKLIGDQNQSDWLDMEEARRLPAPWNITEVNQWFKDHPSPDRDAAKEKREAYYRDLLTQTDKWIERWSASTLVWQQRMDAITQLDDISTAEAKEVLDKTLAAEQADAGPEPLQSSSYLSYAEFAATKKLEPARQVGFAQKGLEELNREVSESPDDLYSTKETGEDQAFQLAQQRAQFFWYEADGYTRSNQPIKALAALAQMNSELQAQESQINGKDDRQKAYASEESSYWRAMGHLAELQKRDTDAMAYYESGLLARLDTGNVPEPGDKDELGAEAHQLWAKLGGTEEGWDMWYGRRANEVENQNRNHLDWEKAQEPLPAFELTDLHGKTWKPSDLKGKVVFLNFWASW